jgi:hypothetical protein
MYQKESDMYRDVAAWLKHLLTQKFKESSIIVQDTSKKVLSKFLFEKGLHKKFPDYQTYEIQVDVTGVVDDRKTARLALVECKLEKINLQDVSQLLGYSKVALPLASIIISPEGISDSINLLFNVHRRDDILSYGQDGCIRIAKWIESKKDIDMQTLIPKGILL